MKDSYMEQDNIILEKIDEVYIKVHADRHVLMELSEYFTFFVPGYQFMPAYKNKIWDGKIRLLDLRTNLLYGGLTTYIEKFCEDRDYLLSYKSDFNKLENFSEVIAKQFYSDLNVHSGGNKIEVYDYQSDAFIYAMRNKRGLLLSPTSSGKSLIIYLITRQLLDYKGMKGLIIVPNVQLVEQLYSDFADYASETDWKVEDCCHRIYQGHEKQTDKKITLSTWQSLHKLPDSYFEKFDFVIGDEAHLYKAKSLTKILTACKNASYRFGLTGTLDGTETHKLVLEGLFGTVKKIISTKELMENKTVAELNIKNLILKHSEENSKLIKSHKDYQKEVDYLCALEERNKFIKNLSLSLKNNTLILYQFVEKHGQILYDMINASKHKHGKQVFFVHGDVATEDREYIRKLLETVDNAIIIASYGTFSTGINTKNLHNIIFAFPSKSVVKVLQSIGRGLRIREGKTSVTLYDIVDDMRVGKHMNYTLKHFIERVKIYDTEKFTYKNYKIGL